MAYTLTLKSLEVITLPEHSVAVPTPSWVDAAITNSKNRMAEKKRIDIVVSSDINITNTTIYIDPALFVPVSFVNVNSGIPPSYWSVTLGPSYVGTYFCSFASPGDPLPFPGRVNAVLLTPLGLVGSTYDFKIQIFYIQSYDVENYTTPALDDNHSRLLKDKRSNPVELSVTGASVYNNTTIDFRCYVYLQNTGAPGNFGNLEINPAYGYKAGFYNKNTHGAAPYFTTPQFILTRNSATVNSVASTMDTAVEFRCTSPVVPSALVIKMIRTDTKDQTVQWEANYELDVNEITAFGVSSTKIKTPFTGPTLVAGITYKWTFNIDKTTIVSNASYRLIAIVSYNNFPANYEVNSFISDEYLVNEDIPYNGAGLTQTATIGDNHIEWTGNDLTASIEERMFSRLVLDFPANQWQNDIFARLGIVTSNDPVRYLTAVEFTIYETYSDFFGAHKQVYDYRFMPKVKSASYLSGTGISINTSVADQITLFAEWRNRYEGYIPNIASYLNGTLDPFGITSTQYWGGKQMFVEWKLTFFYDDYITPFTDNVVLTQKMFVRDYVPDTVLKITAQNPAFDTKEIWCPGEDMCLQGEIVDIATINPADGYNLIVNVDDDPGSITTIEEAEDWATNIYLTQLQSPKVYNEESVYEETTPLMALFCIDEELIATDPVSDSLVNKDIKITVFAKRT